MKRVFRLHDIAPGEPLATPIFPPFLAHEVESLPEDRRLVACGPLEAYLADACEIPLVLSEIGRLREESFRAVGEGTGRAIDLDEFDATYRHLFLWNRETREVAGAYRFASVDVVLESSGVEGLYTSTLFHYRPEILSYLAPALELGRSFVRLEYQKTYSALLLLWKGIGEYLVRHPRHRRLLGAVSISDDYTARARGLMVSVLRRHHPLLPWSAHVRPCRPPKLLPLEAPVTPADADLDHLDGRVREIEKGERGLPVLLRQYLRLGGKLLGFNVDETFSNVLDGLLVIDLLEVESRPFERYMGRRGASRYFSWHASRHPPDRHIA